MSWLPAITLAVLATLGVPLPTPPDARGNSTLELQDPKPTEWPALSGKEKKQVQLEITKLRKARTEEMAADAEVALSTGSAGAMPLLLTAYSKEKSAQTQARIAGVMEALTTAQHTLLLSADFDHKDAGLRTWCLRRAARFPDPALREPALAALAAVQRAGKKADAEERYAAALCTTAGGAIDGFELLRPFALDEWTERGAELRDALTAIRGPEATAALTPGLAAGDRKQTVATLRLLSSAGDESAVQAVAPHLDSDDNQVRVAAINALRGIVDGDGPMENLSVFRAIEVAKTWKQRVAR